MALTRRNLLKASVASGAGMLIPSVALAEERNQLVIPPLIDTRRGKPIFLTMQAVQQQFMPHKTVDAWGFSGLYLGPTIKVSSGNYLKLNYGNRLDSSVAINLQGIQASGELLGGISRVLKPKSGWSPIVPIDQPASTCWYHSTMLGHSAYQVYRGLAGMLIVEDEESREASLPQEYGVNDIPLILQDMQLNSDGKQLYSPNKNQFLGNHLVVNGVEAPYMKVQRGWIRLRLLNASLSRTYQLNMDDGRSLFLLANSLGFLNQPKEVKTFLLTPGERVEVLVDMNGEEGASLISGEKRGMLHSITSLFDGDEVLKNNIVLTMEPDGLLSVFNQDINFNSQRVPSLERLSGAVSKERHIQIDTQNALINGQKIDMRRIDVNARQRTIERWHITSNSPTGFYIQGAKFILESFNQHKVKQDYVSWRDTIWVNGNLTLLVYFPNTSSNAYPFIYGASDLCLSDKGCLGLMTVQA